MCRDPGNESRPRLDCDADPNGMDDELRVDITRTILEKIAKM